MSSDENQGDKNAEDMFMKVAKAYEALTDETSKENYEKFGNPDGNRLKCLLDFLRSF